MDINTLRQLMAQRDSISVLETVDVHTGVRSALCEFDYVKVGRVPLRELLEPAQAEHPARKQEHCC